MKPAHAARASAPPTLIRRTPAAARSATVAKSLPTSTLTGFGATARTTAVMSSSERRPGRVQAVGPGLGVGGQPPDRLGEVRPAGDEPLGATREHDPAAARVERTARGPDAVHRELEREQRLGLVTGRVLDRDPGDSGPRGTRHVGRDTVRLDRVAALEVGVDGDLHRARDRLEMAEHLVEGHPGIGPTQGPGEPGARRREGLEAEHLEVPGAADVPRIGDDEAAGLVQRAERGRAVDGRGHQWRWSSQSAGTRSSGPGTVWSSGWWIGGASTGPSTTSSST